MPEDNTAAPAAEPNPLVLALPVPWRFEGKDYTEIDLRGLARLTIADAVAAQLALFSQREVAASALTETTTAFARELAARATGLPIELFRLAPRALSRRIVRT
ncbi:MAG: phage tail assembly protein, partial [Clostridia bacterium]|nr:phage tail assembly protein [Clostridia bacterium]